MRSLLLLTLLLAARPAADEKDFPPGWMPVARLEAGTEWGEIRKIDDRIHLYLPPDVEAVRGVFVCFVFHSADPRELARLWKFALVTVPWPFEYDLGKNDKRNGRFKLGHPVGNMSFVLRYLEVSAKETKHPELATVPIVGWLGQNGSGLCNDLYSRAPGRVLAWADSWYHAWPKFPELISNVPVASAWEFTGKDEKERREMRDQRLDSVKGKPSPAPDLRGYASTYGFPHGIYSKFNYFMAFMDRCILLRMPDTMPPPGQPVTLKPVVREKGWVGDFNEVSEWNAIAPLPDASGMVEPTWLPDEYSAWMWRSYHSAKPDIKLTGPAVEYRKGGAKECGLGYGGTVAAGSPLRFSAEGGTYSRVEFHDGDRIVGTAESAPWQVEGVKLDRGLHALFVVGVTAEGQRRASRPAFLIVE